MGAGSFAAAVDGFTVGRLALKNADNDDLGKLFS